MKGMTPTATKIWREICKHAKAKAKGDEHLMAAIDRRIDKLMRKAAGEDRA